MIYISMYKAGDSIEMRGIKCDSVRIPITEQQTYKDNGWVDNPEDIKKEPETDAHEVRTAAKAAGIEGHDTKRIKTLKAELDALQG